MGRMDEDYIKVELKVGDSLHWPEPAQSSAEVGHLGMWVFHLWLPVACTEILMSVIA